MVTVIVTSPDNIIIFGASGFIRQFVVEEARGAAEGPSGSLKWASAGQSRQWLEGVLNHPPESDAPFYGESVVKACIDISGEPQFQDSVHVGVGGVWWLIKMFCGGLLFWFLGKFGPRRKFLITFPEFFSFGVFTKAGPNRKQVL